MFRKYLELWTILALAGASAIIGIIPFTGLLAVDEDSLLLAFAWLLLAGLLFLVALVHLILLGLRMLLGWSSKKFWLLCLLGEAALLGVVFVVNGFDQEELLNNIYLYFLVGMMLLTVFLLLLTWIFPAKVAKQKLLNKN